jgi:hypothetical protein
MSSDNAAYFDKSAFRIRQVIQYTHCMGPKQAARFRQVRFPTYTPK